MKPSGIVGVISGDVVKSSKRELSRDAILARLNRALADTRGFLQKRNCSFYASDIYRGDSFQCALTEASYALWAAIFIRTELIDLRQDGIRADVRLGVGLGSASSWNEKNITSSDGEAFRLSGRALDELKSGKEKYRRLRILTPWENDNLAFQALSANLDAIMQSWTFEQAAAMSLFLRAINQAGASRILEVKQPAVQNRLRKAGHFAVKEALEYFSRSTKDRIISLGINNPMI